VVSQLAVRPVFGIAGGEMRATDSRRPIGGEPQLLLRVLGRCTGTLIDRFNEHNTAIEVRERLKQAPT